MNNPTKVIKDYTLLVATGIHIKLYIYFHLPAGFTKPLFIYSFVYLYSFKKTYNFLWVYNNKKIVQHNFRKIKIGARCVGIS